MISALWKAAADDEGIKPSLSTGWRGYAPGPATCFSRPLESRAGFYGKSGMVMIFISMSGRTVKPVSPTTRKAAKGGGATINAESPAESPSSA